MAFLHLLLWTLDLDPVQGWRWDQVLGMEVLSSGAAQGQTPGPVSLAGPAAHITLAVCGQTLLAEG
jgi:hypothetical protein